MFANVYDEFAVVVEKVWAKVAGARPRPFVVCSLASAVSVCAMDADAVMAMYQAEALPGMMMNEVLTAGGPIAAPVGDVAEYHLSTVSAVAVFEMIVPYAMTPDTPPPATTV